MTGSFTENSRKVQESEKHRFCRTIAERDEWNVTEDGLQAAWMSEDQGER